MSSDFDPADFVDSEFQARKASGASAAPSTLRAPSREEVDSKVLETQARLAELKRAQEDLERERAALEESRRRRIEYQTGRQEMLENLTRGVGLLEEAEFVARRDAEQMAKTLLEFKQALAKVEATNEEAWTKDNFNVELTRALTTIENARMEWNSARLKFPVLSGEAAAVPIKTNATPASAPSFTHMSFGELCKLGIAFSWPIAAVLAVGFALLLLVSNSR